MGKLNAWLEKTNARCMFSLPIGHGGRDGYITAYLINCRIALIRTYGDNKGFDIYTAGNDNSITEALVDAEKRLEIKEGR